MTVAPVVVRVHPRSTPPADRRPHPAWLQALPHYDPEYDYRWEEYVYESDFTTDPGYLVANVKTPQSAAQAKFVENKPRLVDFVRYRQLFPGQHSCVRWDRLLQHLDRWLVTMYGPHPRWERLPDRVSPDLALWVTATPLPPDDAYSALTVGVPRLVMECVSRYSRRDSDGCYEEWSTKRTLYAWLGIAEYWIYDPTQEPVRWQGHRLVQPGTYQTIPAAADPRGASPSRVLATTMRVTADHVLQLWDATRDTWFDQSAVAFAQGFAEGLAQGRLDSFLRTLPGTGLPPDLQASLTAYMERLRPHVHALPLAAIPTAGTLWQTLAQHGGPEQVPHDALWALMPPVPDNSP